MNKLFTASLLGTTLVFATVIPSFAAETKGKPTKEVTSLVGYNITEGHSVEASKKAKFDEMDANKDGAVTFKELQNHSILDNEYEAFSAMDTNKNKSIDLSEFAHYSPTKGDTEFESIEHGKKSVRGTNLKSRVYEETTYFMPVEKKIVKEEAIEPASGK